MGLFTGNQTCLYLERTKISFYNSKSLVSTLEFPKEVYANLEVIDSSKFQSLVQNFLKDNKLAKKEVSLIVSPDLIFQRELSSDSSDETNRFFSELPFDPTKVLSKIVTNSGKKTVFATNKIPIDNISSVQSGLEGKITQVLPLSLFNLTAFDSNSLKIIFKNKALLSLGNLLSNQSSHEEPDQSNKKTPRPINKKVLIEISTIILLLLVVVAIFYLKNSKSSAQPENKKTVPSKVTSNLKTPNSASSAASLVPTESTTSAKEKITIQVLNGTGRAGDAGKVRDALLAAGFSQIETGNLSLQNATDTQVSYSATVSADIKKIIDTVLKDLFNAFTMTAASTSSTFSISIITGK